MRIKWILAGVFGTSAIAAASPLPQFYTVINQGDSIAGDQFYAASQVVVGDGGVVGIVGALFTSGNEVVIYSTPSAGNTWNSQTVAEGDTSTNVSGLGANEEFQSFDNLALTGNPSDGARLTFAAVSTGSQAGILQWDDNASITSLGNVAFEGSGYNQVGGDGTDSGGGTIELQVNGSGQVLFPAVPSTTQELVRGDRSSVTPIFTNSGSLGIADVHSRVALGADNSGAALLSNSGTPGVYNVPAGGGAPIEVSGSYTPVHNTGAGNTIYHGDPVMGYASNGAGLNATLMLAVSPANSSQEDIVLSKNSGASQFVLANSFTPPSDGSIQAEGEMTPDGQIALYVPNGGGADDQIDYADAASLSPVATPVASIGEHALDAGGTSRIIQAVQEAGLNWVPQINDSGTIAFLAQVSTSLTDLTPETALLDWQPGDVSPTVLLWENETVNIGGQPETISDLYFNQLAEENDFYKNALSDDGYLAIGVGYDDNNAAAVLITQVPEPATMALLPMIGLGLLARRKRQP